MSSDLPASNEACETIPPVQSSYAPTGQTIKLAAYDEVYAVGDQTSSTVIIGLCDVFGLAPQTIQGADLLAKSVGARVLLPDVFFGKPLPMDYPTPDDELNKKLRAGLAEFTAMDKMWPKLESLVRLVREDTNVKKVYSYGLCWSGKAVTIIGGRTIDVNGNSISPFDGVASIHPGHMSSDDTKDLLVPLALFPSKAEPIEEYQKSVTIISAKPFASKNAYRYYSSMHHGWAGARANLDKEDNLAEFGDVYARLATFFKNVGEA